MLEPKERCKTHIAELELESLARLEAEILAWPRALSILFLPASRTLIRLSHLKRLCLAAQVLCVLKEGSVEIGGLLSFPACHEPKLTQQLRHQNFLSTKEAAHLLITTSARSTVCKRASFTLRVRIVEATAEYVYCQIVPGHSLHR